MSDAEPGRLHAYYQARGLSPTFGNLRTEEDLDRYAAARERLFTDRLNLPPRLLDGARVLEFGPDTGENALVFARWGATVDLVEPNRQSWPQIGAYFQHFGLADRLGPISAAAIQDFRPERRYDLVVAEGFIQTVKPDALWIEGVREAVAPGGFLVLFYYERTALLVELFHRAVYRETCRLLGGDGVEIARRLYGPKWDAIPHTRRFESWVMDVLDNPYTSTAYTIDANELVREMPEAGFAFYQSWPRYRDELRLAWHKSVETADDVAAEFARHLPRVALGHALGRTLLTIGDEDEVAAVAGCLSRVLIALDRATAAGGKKAWAEIGADLSRLGHAIGDPMSVFAPAPENRHAALQMVRALADVCRHLSGGDVEGLMAFTTTDAAFLSAWGQPAHYAVFRKRD